MKIKHSHKPKHLLATDGLFEYRSIEKKKLKFCMVITGIVMIIELGGGILFNSLALISDAAHMFTHFFALAISFGAILCASIERCHHRTFGFYRAEILAALFNSLFLFVVTIWILIEGIKRIIHPQIVLSSQMFIVAFVGLIVNLVSIWILHGVSKHDLNIKGAFLHMLADTLSSIIIVIGAAIIYFTGLNIIDPILSIAVAIVILIWGWGLFRDSVNILLEAAPKGIDRDEVSKVLREQIPQIEAISDMHLWTITSNMHSMTLHLKLREPFTREDEKEIVCKIKQIVDQRFNIEHTTIELE